MTEQPAIHNQSASQASTPQARWSGLAILLILAAFGLRLRELTLQDIWWDEARNLDVALRPLAQIATASELDIHPPLYFWLLHAWLKVIGATGEMGAEPLAFLGRFLSVGAGLVAVVLLWVWGRRLGGARQGKIVGAIALLLGAFSPFWLAESQETRMYTLGFALATGAGLVLLQAVAVPNRVGVNRGISPRRLLPYVLWAAAALLVHYNMAFVLAAWHLWWLIWAAGQSARLRSVLENFGAGFAVLILASPILPIALRQIPTYANPNLIVPSVGQYLADNWRAYWGGYAVDGTSMAAWADYWLVVILLLGGVGGVMWLVRGRSRAAAKSDWRVARAGVSFLLIWLVGGLALYYIAVWDRGAFNVRYASFVTPALYLLLSVALAALGPVRRVLLATLVVGGGLLSASLADLYDPAFFREDVRGVVAWLEDTAEPEDMILVDQRYPFGFYWRDFVNDPNAVDIPSASVTQQPQARYLFVDVNTLDTRLNVYLAGASRVFWVQWFESDTDPRRAVPFLLDKVGSREAGRDFRGFAVNVWQLPPQAEFTLADAWLPVEIGFEGAATALEAALPATIEGTQVPVVVRWGRFEPLTPRRWKARVALYNGDGARVAQIDTRLLNDRHLFPGEWQAGDTPLNVYMLRLDAPPPPGLYELRLLVYDEDAPDFIAWPHVANDAQAVDGVELILGTLAAP
ncbi:MAG: hypothetical protein WDZ49_09575 [Litorilinea sp.]